MKAGRSRVIQFWRTPQDEGSHRAESRVVPACCRAGVGWPMAEAVDPCLWFARPEIGFQPTTCRLRGHRSPATMVAPGKVAQLRKAERQGRNDSVKDETLAETLAEQSKLRAVCSMLWRCQGFRLDAIGRGRPPGGPSTSLKN